MLWDYVTPHTHTHTHTHRHTHPKKNTLTLNSYRGRCTEWLWSFLITSHNLLLTITANHSSLIKIIKTLHLCMSPPGGSTSSLVMPSRPSLMRINRSTGDQHQWEKDRKRTALDKDLQIIKVQAQISQSEVIYYSVSILKSNNSRLA